MRIIPAIDIIDGGCVRLERGDFSRQKNYSADPVDIARRYEAAGVRYLHLVDLDGARQKKIVNRAVLERIALATDLHIDFGGGIQSEKDLRIAFDCGAAQVTAGSIAVKSPATVQAWLAAFGADRFILGADVKDNKIAIHGWQEHTDVALFPFVEQWHQAGIDTLICTDIARDGVFAGPATALYSDLKARLPGLRVIASGGVSSIDDLQALQAADIDGVIIGKALLEGRITLEALAAFL